VADVRDHRFHLPRAPHLHDDVKGFEISWQMRWAWLGRSRLGDLKEGDLKDRGEDNRWLASLQAHSTDARNEISSAAEDKSLGLGSGSGRGMEEE
jgi:hypothetical protein